MKRENLLVRHKLFWCKSHHQLHKTRFSWILMKFLRLLRNIWITALFNNWGSVFHSGLSYFHLLYMALFFIIPILYCQAKNILYFVLCNIKHLGFYNKKIWLLQILKNCANEMSNIWRIAKILVMVLDPKCPWKKLTLNKD